MPRLTAIIGAIAWTIASVPTRAAEPALAVIVHRDRQASLSADELSNIYLKKRRFWEDGTAIVPLNRESGSAEREAFSQRALGRASTTFMGYWNQEYFHGVFPPATLSSSNAMKRYVAADRNAIGYVWLTEVDETVRVVLRIE